MGRYFMSLACQINSNKAEAFGHMMSLYLFACFVSMCVNYSNARISKQI